MKINITSNNIKLIKRDSLLEHIKPDLLASRKVLTIEQVNKIYQKLLKYSLQDDTIKQAHINNIKSRQ